jgi:hypothetical protein
LIASPSDIPDEFEQIIGPPSEGGPGAGTGIPKTGFVVGLKEIPVLRKILSGCLKSP